MLALSEDDDEVVPADELVVLDRELEGVEELSELAE